MARGGTGRIQKSRPDPIFSDGSPNNSMEYIKAWAEGRQKVVILIL